MKFIQSYWFDPFSDLRSTRFRGGFPEERFFWYSLALSAILIKEQYGPVSFYTDAHGAELSEQFKLPYGDVLPLLDSIEVPHKFLWVYGKLRVCAVQNQPFLHLDCDVFLTAPLESDALQARVLVQHIEHGPYHREYYWPAMQEIAESLEHVPLYYRTMLEGTVPFKALNCGVVGGTEWSVIAEASSKGCRMIDAAENAPAWEMIGKKHDRYRQAFNCAIEQVNLALACDAAEIQVRTLFEVAASDHSPPGSSDFIHLVGESKFQANTLRAMEVEFKRRAPKLKAHIDSQVRQ